MMLEDGLRASLLASIILSVGLMGSSFDAAAQSDNAAPPQGNATPPSAPGAADDATTEDGKTVEAQAEDIEESAASLTQLDPETFEDALADFYAKDYVDAALGFYQYLRANEATADQYEWAQFFLAECLAALELWHGAVHYYAVVAKNRSRPEILPDALRRLHTISKRYPFSEELVHNDLLYDTDFGNVAPDLANWINYIQGLFDLRNGFKRWSKRHFEAIAKDNEYRLRADYVEAVGALRDAKEELSAELFAAITKSKLDVVDVKNEAHLALARLHFDLEQYAEAKAEYAKVKQNELSFEQAQLLLEQAWTEYNLGDKRAALGLLHALEAPSYQPLFLPDAYILRALILKEFCHFIDAKRTLRAFRARFGRALDQLTARKPLEENREILLAATQQGSIARRTRFIEALRSERKRIDRFDSTWEDVELDMHLRRLYDLELREQVRLWRTHFQVESKQVAITLLKTQEQADLLDYEIGLDIFKRVKVNEAVAVEEEDLTIPYDSQSVYYGFDSEFWNNELRDYKYFIRNRCVEFAETP